MKIKILDKDGKEETYEFAPIGGEDTVRFPFLFLPKSGGRHVPIAEVHDDSVIMDLFSKSFGLDPDFRAMYLAEIFSQLLHFKPFLDYFVKHYIVNHVIDPDGRFFKIAVEFCPNGVQLLDEDEKDLIFDEAFIEKEQK